MDVQLLKNNRFVDGLRNYSIQGTVSAIGNITSSEAKTALLLSTPDSISQISQVVCCILPGVPLKFSFRARRLCDGDIQSTANIRAEVNFISVFGPVIPPSIIINVRGRDVAEDEWNLYEDYGLVPFGTLKAQVVIRLEPPASGTSGLLIDELTLGLATPELNFNS